MLSFSRNRIINCILCDVMTVLLTLLSLQRLSIYFVQLFQALKVQLHQLIIKPVMLIKRVFEWASLNLMVSSLLVYKGCRMLGFQMVQPSRQNKCQPSMFLQNHGLVQTGHFFRSNSFFLSSVTQPCAYALVRFRHNKNTWLGLGKHHSLA